MRITEHRTVYRGADQHIIGYRKHDKRYWDPGVAHAGYKHYLSTTREMLLDIFHCLFIARQLCNHFTIWEQGGPSQCPTIGSKIDTKCCLSDVIGLVNDDWFLRFKYCFLNQRTGFKIFRHIIAFSAESDAGGIVNGRIHLHSSPLLSKIYLQTN